MKMQMMIQTNLYQARSVTPQKEVKGLSISNHK
jgi:hypothetical protein